jgi:hypothetical protein
MAFVLNHKTCTEMTRSRRASDSLHKPSVKSGKKTFCGNVVCQWTCKFLSKVMIIWDLKLCLIKLPLLRVRKLFHLSTYQASILYPLIYIIYSSDRIVTPWYYGAQTRHTSSHLWTSKRLLWVEIVIKPVKLLYPAVALSWLVHNISIPAPPTTAALRCIYRHASPTPPHQN